MEVEMILGRIKRAEKLLILSALICVLCVLSACASDAEIARATAEYTSETARAITAAGWKVAGSIFGGLVLHALITS